MRTTRLYLALLLTCSCLVYPVSGTANGDSIKVPSFNVAELGEGTHPDTRDELAIAGMLVNLDLDLIAIQEVGTVLDGESQVQLITSYMNGLQAANSC